MWLRRSRRQGLPVFSRGLWRRGTVMEKFIGITDMVLPVVAMIVIGIVARRTGLISEKGIGDIKTFIVRFTLPATLFQAFYTVRFSWREGVMLLLIAAISLIAFFAGFFVCKLFNMSERIAPYLCTTIEGGSIGYALAILMSGQKNLYHFALLDVGNALIQWGVVMTVLQVRSGEGKSAKEIVRSLITPVNIAIVSGLLFSVTGIGPAIAAAKGGVIVDDVLSFVSAPTGPVIMMTIGYGLSLSGVRWKETLKGAACRALCFGILGIAVFFLTPLIFPGDPLYKSAVLLFFIMPPTYAFSVFTQNEKEDAYVSSFLAIYTIFTIIAFIPVAWTVA